MPALLSYLPMADPSLADHADGIQSVCVRLNWINLAVDLLQGSSVLVACVVGFHEGTQSISDKVKYGFT